MAITTTNARYEGFIFDGENSRTYGVYVTDVEVFGAPVRNVEMISIPGRNGSFALDKGSYENIQVTYKCAMGCESQADFNAGISAFRNMLASRTGYKRLEDEINTSEYRMACFRGGISVPTLNKETATFDVVFDCKPQRYLKSGETAVSVANGGTISNPTLYDASPMLQVWGYGGMAINGEELEVFHVPVGEIVISNYKSTDRKAAKYCRFPISLDNLANGDTFKVNSPSSAIYLTGEAIEAEVGNTIIVQKTSATTSWENVYALWAKLDGKDCIHILTATNTSAAATFQKGTNSSYGQTFNIECGSFTLTYTVYVSYDNAQYIDIGYAYNSSYAEAAKCVSNFVSIIGDSSKSALGEPLYFDLDIGEAYKIEDGQTVSVNNAVTIPAKLPVLVPNSNTITYDNTITQFKIVPRWWQL